MALNQMHYASYKAAFDWFMWLFLWILESLKPLTVFFR